MWIYKGLDFCRNNGWIMKNMDKGLTVPKLVLIVQSKIPQMPQNLSTQFICPSNWISMRKASLGVRSPWLLSFSLIIFQFFPLSEKFSWNQTMVWWANFEETWITFWNISIGFQWTTGNGHRFWSGSLANLTINVNFPGCLATWNMAKNWVKKPEKLLSLLCWITNKTLYII